MARRISLSTQALLLGSGVFGNVAMSALAPALPRIEASFANVSGADYWTKFLISATGLGVIIASPLTGTLVRLFGRRAVLIGAYVAFLAFGLIGMALPGLTAIIVSRFLAGAAGAIIVALGFILIGDLYEGTPRERRIGANHAIGAILLAGLIAGAGALADIQWRLAFLVHLAALPMIVIAIGNRDLQHLPDAHEGAGRDGTAGRLPGKLIPVMALALLIGGISYSVQIYVPFHLRRIGSDSSALAGAMFAITVSCSVLTSLLYAELRRWLSVTILFAITLAGMAAGLLTTALTASVGMTIAGMVAAGLAGGLIGPNLVTTVSAMTEGPARAHAVGWVKGFYYFGPFFGPTALQLLALNGDAETALAALGACAALLTFCCLAVAAGLHLHGRRDRLAAGRATS